jgi:mannose-6-phosphate isomerase-like protein (cupin superfamily)
MKLTFVIGLLLSLPLAAQTAGKPEVFSAKDIKAQLASLAPQAKSAGSGSTVIGKYGTHNIMLSARTTSGGGEVHQHFDDVMIVTEGTATLITGGTLVDPHTESDGELRGKSIKDGQSQTVSVGDVVHVPAGTPHQLILAPGTAYSAMVVKVKE